jgi:hypothetical protein
MADGPLAAAISVAGVIFRLAMCSIAEVEPKSTFVALANPVPVIVTEVPPATGPYAGDTEEAAGADM